MRTILWQEEDWNALSLRAASVISAHYVLNRNTDHLSGCFSGVSPHITQAWNYPFILISPLLSRRPSWPLRGRFPNCLVMGGRAEGGLVFQRMRARPIFSQLSSSHPQHRCLAPDFASMCFQFFWLPPLHLWPLLLWACALRSMAVCGVFEQVNGLLTPHHWLAWLIRQRSTPCFASPAPPPLSSLLPSSLVLCRCQMVSMQSWEQRKIKGRHQRLENQESTAVIPCCSDDTFTGFMHFMESNLRRGCKWENTSTHTTF